MVERRYRTARVEGILDALSQGKSGYEDLCHAAESAEDSACSEYGLASENRFIRYSSLTSFIKDVRDATPYEDVFEGIDKWIVFEDFKQLPELPVQIKSSYKAVSEFRKSRKYRSRGGMEIVINCGPAIELKHYKNQLRREMGRIKSILDFRSNHQN